MGALSPNPEDTHSTPVPGHAHRSHAARQGPGGREGAQFPAPCLQGRLSARGQWAFGGAGWACCWAALGACRRSGCSLVFSDAGELWALAQFATPIFRQEVSRSRQGPLVPPHLGLKWVPKGTLSQHGLNQDLRRTCQREEHRPQAPGHTGHFRADSLRRQLLGWVHKGSALARLYTGWGALSWGNGKCN